MAFHSTDAAGFPVYHTNVMMAVGTDVAVVCLESVADPKERRHLLASLRRHQEVRAPALLPGSRLWVRPAECASLPLAMCSPCKAFFVGRPTAVTFPCRRVLGSAPVLSATSKSQSCT